MKSARLMAVLLATVAALGAVTWSSPAAPRSLCGQSTAGKPAVQHVIIVMLENRSYNQVVGSPAAPFQTRLVRECGSATEAFGATHGSAPNYLAVSAGQYPTSSLHGCAYLACLSGQDSIYQQLDRAGLTWKAYEEAIPSACDKVSSWPYKIGHDPATFYAGIGAWRPAASGSECGTDWTWEVSMMQRPSSRLDTGLPFKLRMMIEVGAGFDRLMICMTHALG